MKVYLQRSPPRITAGNRTNLREYGRWPASSFRPNIREVAAAAGVLRRLGGAPEARAALADPALKELRRALVPSAKCGKSCNICELACVKCLKYFQHFGSIYSENRH